MVQHCCVPLLTSYLHNLLATRYKHVAQSPIRWVVLDDWRMSVEHEQPVNQWAESLNEGMQQC